MLYAWINGVKRPPLTKGERTSCPDCGGLLTSVIPVENVKHWRHKAGDCDPWSEPEGPWHLGWKEQFDLACREVGLVDGATGERHRADVLCGLGTPNSTVLELQHSSISEEERGAREATAHVFFDYQGHIFFLAGDELARRLNGDPPLRKGEFALCRVPRDQFVRSVQGLV